MFNISLGFYLLLWFRVHEIFLFLTQQTDQSIFFHLWWSLVVGTPDVFYVLSIQATHSFPFKHIILCSSFKFILFTVLAIKTFIAADSLRKEIWERGIGWSWLKIYWLIVLQESLNFISFDLHFLCNSFSGFNPSFLHLLFSLFYLFFVLGLLFSKFLSFIENRFLFVFPMFLYLCPLLFPRKYSWKLLK